MKLDAPTLVDVVVMALPRRRRNAITIARLAHRLGMPTRAVEEALQAIAADGRQPLCAATSKPAGVWLGSPDEVVAYVGQLGSRITHQQERRAGLVRYLRNLPEPRLWDTGIAS